MLRLAVRQWGVVARWQLLECGISGTTISRWVAAGRLHRIYPGVYAVGHTALPLAGRSWPRSLQVRKAVAEADFKHYSWRQVTRGSRAVAADVRREFRERRVK